MHERPPIITADGGEIPGREEVDKRLHDKVDSTETRVENITKDEADALERDFNESPEIREYLSQPTNITKIEQINSWLGPECEKIGLKPAITSKILETVEILLNDAKDYCHRYAHTVQRFEHLRRGRFRMADREYAERLARIDSDRRLTHNATLGTFRTYNEYVSIKLYEKHKIDVPKEYLFDDDRIFLDRQGYGTEWIQTTDYFLQARSLINAIKKEGSKQSSDPSERSSDESADAPDQEPKG